MSQKTSEPVANEIAALIGPFWTESKVCDVLGVAADELAVRRAEGTVLALTSTDGDTFYPVDQFQRRGDERLEVRAALVPLLRTLRSFDAWTVAVLLHTPAPELGGLTPLDWARQGGTEGTLADLALVVSREWAAGAATTG